MTSKVRKVLMRSTPDDVVVIMTNNIGHSFVLSRGGKEVWLPEQWNLVYSYIIDIAFLEGTLYAITQEEDLFPIHIDLDGDGKFIIARGKRIIRQPTSSCGYSPWTVFDGEEDEARTSEKEATETSDEDDGEEGEVATPENKKATSNEDGDKAKEYDGTLPDCFDYVKEDVPHGSKALSITVRYLVESRMKLLMSRVLVVGGTGYIGRRIVKASLAQGHETNVLMRPDIGLNVEKLQLLLSFKAQGARLVEASLGDHQGLVAGEAGGRGGVGHVRGHSPAAAQTGGGDQRSWKRQGRLTNSG
ncbi:hypothetical protein ZWY2020_008452 [Hordeum vulgare]|nr:hypothetical protein ZWY2020_008452 [Hordeum vulgare]